MTTRPLSAFENFYRSRTASEFYRNFQVTSTYSHDISTELLFAALRKTVLDYHILVCNIFTDKASKCCVYRPLDRVLFKEVVFQKDEDKYLENGLVTEEYMKMVNTITFQLDAEKPLFRVILLGKRHLSVVLEHTIADGLVGNYFHEILVENLAFVDNEQNQQVLESEYKIKKADNVWEEKLFERGDVPKHVLPPPIDDFMEPPINDYTFGDREYFDTTPPPGFPKRWEGKLLASREAQLSFKLLHFGPETMQQILAACKKHGVSLTAYLTMVLAATICPLTDPFSYTSHKVATALRRHMNAENGPDHASFFRKKYKILGSSATGFATNLPPVEGCDWEVARQIHKNIGLGAANRRGLHPMNVFFETASHLGDNRSFFDQGLGKPKADTVKVSNLGLVPTPVYQGSSKAWRIEQMVFSQDVSPSAAEFQLNVIATTAGLNIVFSYFAEVGDLARHLQTNIETFATGLELAANSVRKHMK